MLKTNFVHFIIATLGRKSLIKTIESIKHQNASNWDLLLVFDGFNATPVTDSKINIITCNHKNAGFARNEGIKTVNSGWLAFVDDDDVISSDYVSTINQIPAYIDLIQFPLKLPDGIWKKDDPKWKIHPNATFLNHAVKFDLISTNNILFKKGRISREYPKGGGEDFYFFNDCYKHSKPYVVQKGYYHQLVRSKWMLKESMSKDDLETLYNLCYSLRKNKS